ncbi:MAG: GDP-mannose dehydrogenase, partial [Deltaproteobacteria bacterium]
AVANSEISLVCVGTPSQTNGDLDTSFVQRVCEHIGTQIKNKSSRHVVVIRSTILPGTIKNIVIPALEAGSGKVAGQDFGVCNNPEFLREGTAVYDFYNPPKTVIGETDAISGDLAASIYEKLDAPVIRTSIEVAEMIKYVDNVWHALKVGFGNEMGSICKFLGVDSHEVMDIFVRDTKLNISPYYLKPGFAFGGSCLPKDVRALVYKGKSLDIDLPILNAILPSNDSHIKNGLRMVMEAGSKNIGFLGFSFKAGTDDLRESPVVEMIERLLGKGYEIKLYDKNVNLAALIGANKDFIMNKIPHIAKLMVKTMEEVLEHAQTIVIGNNSFEFKDLMDKVREDQQVIDLVRAVEDRNTNGFYNGLCW